MEALHEARKDDRSEFQRDYDRLIFSAPFRRLQNKTQVFPLPGSIFVHNRLTHSLEVSCVGRSLGNEVVLALQEKHPELKNTLFTEIGSIVSAACLAHDLGNPPRTELKESTHRERVERSYSFRWQCKRFSHSHSPVQRTARGRFRHDLFYVGFHCKVSVFIAIGRKEGQIRILLE